MKITTTVQAKTAVSALRREIKSLGKAPGALSHNDCLTLMAKAMGYSGWNAWEASLADVGQEKSAVEAPAAPKYPLTNNGEFDFVKPGEHGLPFQGDFTRLENTSEVVEAKSSVTGAFRSANTNFAGVGNSGLEVMNWRSTIFDDTMAAKTENGNVVWISDDGDMYSGVVVLAPMECHYPQYDEDLPVRPKLLEAYLEYYAEQGIDDSALEGCFDKAQGVLGIHLTENEEEHLLDSLRDIGLANKF